MFDLSVISILFDVGVVALNLIMLGIFTGHVTRWALRVRPAAFSERYTRGLLVLTAVTILASDLLLVLEIAG